MPNPENLKPFKKGHDERRNYGGRPKKLVSSVIMELEESGYKRATAIQVREALEMLINLDESKITEVIQDKEQPMLLRIIAKRMLSKDGHEMVEKILDRTHGKAKQQMDVTTGGEKLAPSIDFSKLTYEQLVTIFNGGNGGHSGNGPDGGQT